MTAHDTVRAVAGTVGKLGGAWMFAPETAARGEELGLKGWSWYHLGRGGVLGDADADAVIAAFGFFPPALQRKAWDKGRAVMPADQAATAYAVACAAWGSSAFAGLDGTARLTELLTRVSDAADPAGLPVFAGWRALAARTDADDAGRLALALQVARELRGGAHLVAVVAQGVAPLQAVVSGRYGPSNAEFFGWPQPWPDPDAAKQQMRAAEDLTDALLVPAFSALTDAEGDELVELLAAAKAAAA